MSRYLVAVLLCVVGIPTSEGTINLEVQLDSYSNPTHQHSDQTLCTDECSNVFQFCLCDVNGRGRACVYGNFTTNVIASDNFTFTSMVASELGITNPLVFDDFAPNVEIQLVVSVTDVSNGSCLVDELEISFPDNLSTASYFTGTTSYSGNYQVAMLQLSFRITSNCPNYMYGQNCSNTCGPSMKYYCNYIGNRVCNENYYPMGNCTQFCDGELVHSGNECDHDESDDILVLLSILITVAIVVVIVLVFVVPAVVISICCCKCLCRDDEPRRACQSITRALLWCPCFLILLPIDLVLTIILFVLFILALPIYFICALFIRVDCYKECMKHFLGMHVEEDKEEKCDFPDCTCIWFPLTRAVWECACRETGSASRGDKEVPLLM